MVGHVEAGCAQNLVPVPFCVGQDQTHFRVIKKFVQVRPDYPIGKADKFRIDGVTKFQEFIFGDAVVVFPIVQDDFGVSLQKFPAAVRAVVVPDIDFIGNGRVVPQEKRQDFRLVVAQATNNNVHVLWFDDTCDSAIGRLSRMKPVTSFMVSKLH